MVTGQREGYSGRGGMDQGPHQAPFDSFLGKNVGSEERRTAADGYKVTLSPPSWKTVIHETRSIKPRDKRRAVFLIGTSSSLHSTLIGPAASNTFARDQEIGFRWRFWGVGPRMLSLH